MDPKASLHNPPRKTQQCTLPIPRGTEKLIQETLHPNCHKWGKSLVRTEAQNGSLCYNLVTQRQGTGASLCTTLAFSNTEGQGWEVRVLVLMSDKQALIISLLPLMTSEVQACSPTPLSPPLPLTGPPCSVFLTAVTHTAGEGLTAKFPAGDFCGTK